MTYSKITFKDKNLVKRWLQKQRLVSALDAVKESKCEPLTICDFGSGNGELCKSLRKQYPKTHIICYEPHPTLLNEAKVNLIKLENISYVQDIGELDNESIDLVFSLEVFEHLPNNETYSALQVIYALLRSNGQLIIGVPVEVGIPALYKGAFRMVRRYGAFDANIKNVFMSFLYKPPVNRPTSEITHGFKYHFEHVGFDYRRLPKILGTNFKNLTVSSSPFSFMGIWLMPEVYFNVEKS